MPWHKTRVIRRREILVPESVPRKSARPIRSENRALLVASIARGRRWLEELTTDPAVTPKASPNVRPQRRKVNMTISLAVLAPDLVKAAWTNDGERSAQRENPDGARSVIV